MAKHPMRVAVDRAEARLRLENAAPDLLAACKAQHEAIDRLFAMLIVATRSGHVRTEKGFMPTESGQPWDAALAGNAAIAKAAGEARAPDPLCSLCGKPADFTGPCGWGGCPLGADL